VLTGGALSCTDMAMEWPYAVASAALGFFAFTRGRPGLALLAGALGVLARSDFAGFALCTLAVSLLPQRPGETWAALPRATRLASVAFGVGALAGLALVSIHTFAVSGHLVQASARIKEHWGRLAGYNVLPALDAPSIATPLGYVMLRLFHWGPLTFVLIAAPALAFVAVRALRPAEPGSLPPVARHAALVSVATLTGYALVYGFNADAAQPWYSSNALVPLVVVHAVLFDAIPRRALRVAAGVAALLVAASVATARKPNWLAQELTWRAALELERSPSPGRLASWNAGILAFFSGHEVVNIDGLMNDAVYPYVVSGTLDRYILRAGIDFIVDSPVMFSSHQAARGGYASGILRRALRGRVLVEDGAGHSRVLYQVDRSELAAEVDQERSP
jgi:hypothetical protein